MNSFVSAFKTGLNTPRFFNRSGLMPNASAKLFGFRIFLPTGCPPRHDLLLAYR